MQLALDHLVHFLDRPPVEATEKFRQHGFHAVAGGRHEPWGTWNSLSYFGLSYVEFLSIEVRALAERSENPLIRQLVEEIALGEGLAQIALRTNRMNEWVNKLQKKDLIVQGPVAGSRKREDGSILSWRMLFFEDPQSKLRPPFLIEWQQSDEERENDLKKRGSIAPHPNQSNSLQQVGVAAAELEDAVQTWKRWLDCEVSEAWIDERIGARCQALELGGTKRIVFCQPIAAGLASEALAAGGQRPFFATIAGATAGHDQIFGATYFREEQ
ncbi:VOC family protein [Brevibacillus reuszeri]|uniref:VOC family protein n=1 Tax=Brevibacillus reuszeri TaxID=54915 RepID=UPI0028A215B8|nr:VOC family protein [Brevibacillus reuszeri]